MCPDNRPHEAVDENVQCKNVCLYRDKAGVCHYHELSPEAGDHSMERVAQVMNVPLDKMQSYVSRVSKRIQVGLVAQAYFTYATDTVNIGEDRQTHALHRLFGVGERTLRSVLDRERYESWRTVSGADIPFDDVYALFSEVLEQPHS